MVEDVRQGVILKIFEQCHKLPIEELFRLSKVMPGMDKSGLKELEDQWVRTLPKESLESLGVGTTSAKASKNGSRGGSRKASPQSSPQGGAAKRIIVLDAEGNVRSAVMVNIEKNSLKTNIS